MKYNIYQYKKRITLAAMLLLFVFLPFKGQEIATPADSTNIDIAYGKRSKDMLTSSVSSVKGSDLKKTHVSTLSNTFFGRFSGMSTIQTDGEIGYDEATLYLRGQHTFGNNGYIVLLDGFEIDGFNQITPDEIESVSILKDASALAMYGISGANGAILITTKRGVNSGKKMKITLNARYGIQSPISLPKFEGSYNYAKLYNEALSNDGLPMLYSEKELQGYKDGTDPYMYPNVNWYDEVLKNTSDIQDYTLTFSGGNQFARYFVMAGYMNSRGLYKNTDQKNNSNIQFQRINFRANVDLNITKSFSAEVNLGGRIEDRAFPPTGTGTFWKNMATYAPNLYPVRTPGGQITGTAAFPDNPVGSLLNEGYGSRNSRDVQGTVKLAQKLDFITEGLSVFGKISISSVYQGVYNKTRSYAYYEPINTISSLGQDSMYYVRRANDTDLAVTTSGDSETDRMAFQAGLEYNQVFGDNSINALAMYHQDKYYVLGNQSPYAKQNIMGRMSYAYKSRYLADFTFSYSGTDNYPSGNRFGFFPALSLGWILTKEDFLKDRKGIDFLKIRGSAGLLGSDKGVPRFGYNQYWGPSSNQGYYFGAGTTYHEALVQLALANPDLTWEKSLLYDFGIETRWLGNKLSFDADIFYENRYDILVNNTNIIPNFSGTNISTLTNRGKARNYGLELSSMFTDRVGHVNYFVGAKFDFIKNEITESYETPHTEAYRYQQGRPIGQQFGLEALGFFKDETDIANSPYQTFSEVHPGDLKYKDQNGDNIIDVDDEIAIGKPACPQINFSANFGASYKGFDIELLFQGNANRSISMNASANNYMFWPYVNNGGLSTWAAEGRWTPETHNSATFPRLTTETNSNNYWASDFWIRDFSLLRLRNAELGYTFSGSWLKKFRIEKFRMYVSAVNLFTLDNLDIDVDPETLSVGYPTLKTYTIGLSLNF